MNVSVSTEVRTDDDDTMTGTELVTVHVNGVIVHIYPYGENDVVIEADSGDQTAANAVRVRIDDMEVYR